MKHAVLAALLLASACAPSVDVIHTNAPPHTMYPRLAKDVLIVHAPPAQPYVEVANLHFVSHGPADEDERIATLHDQAAQLGCDVLWLDATRSASPNDAVCLVFTQVGASANAGTSGAF